MNLLKETDLVLDSLGALGELQRREGLSEASVKKRIALERQKEVREESQPR